MTAGQSVIAVFVVFGAIHCAAWAYPFSLSLPPLVRAITAPFGFFVALTLVAVILSPES